MIPSLLLLAALAPADVDMTLTPSSQTEPLGCIAEIDLVLSASAATSVATVDVILSWDPTKLTLIQAIPGDEDWFAAAFLNDPDGINDDVTDGDALFTALPNPAIPLALPPDLVVATFQFTVLDDGVVEMLPSLGTYGLTRVLGTTPGVELTGVIAPPVDVFVNLQPSIEVSRVGVPPNPDVFLPGVTTGAVIGQFWDPFIDHTSFMPASIFDAFIMTPGPVNVALPPYGTLLCQLPYWGHPFGNAPGIPFSIYIPFDCNLVGAGFCAQAFSIDALGNAELTNALDVTIGVL